MGLVTTTKKHLRSALGGTLRAVRSEFRGGSAIEDRGVNSLDNTPTITYFYKRKDNMRYTYIVTDEEGKAEDIQAMSYKKMLKRLDKKKTFWVTYKNKKGNPQTKVIVNGKEQKNIHA